MSLVFLVAGLIILSRQAIPPWLLGGSVRHTTDAPTSRLIGMFFLIPLVLDVVGLLWVHPDSLLGAGLYFVFTYIWAGLAIMIHYKFRDPIPVDAQGMLTGTDIPADKADLAQLIANKAYRSTLLFGLSLLGGVGFIFGALAIVQTTQAIRLSVEHNLAAPQRRWARVMRSLSIIGMVASAACLVLIAVSTLYGPQLSQLAAHQQSEQASYSGTPRRLPPATSASPIHLPPPDSYCDGDGQNRRKIADTFLCIRSEPGEYVSEGKSYVVTPDDAEFKIEYQCEKGQTRIYLRVNQENWLVEFRAPEGEPLVANVYENAMRAAFADPGFSGLWVFINGRPCNTLKGKYEIVQTGCEPGATSQAFAASFEQYCENESIPLRGGIRVQLANP